MSSSAIRRQFRLAVSLLLIPTLLAPTTGCYTMQTVAVPATEPPSPHFEGPVYWVTTASGEEVTFDEPGEIRVPLPPPP